MHPMAERTNRKRRIFVGILLVLILVSLVVFVLDLYIDMQRPTDDDIFGNAIIVPVGILLALPYFG